MPADVFAAPSTAFFWNAFPVFLLMAAVTIATPGPGVIMTLTNTVRFGLRNSLGGILGLAAGIFCVATLSARGWPRPWPMCAARWPITPP